jgi:hypothetical protein
MHTELVHALWWQCWGRAAALDVRMHRAALHDGECWSCINHCSMGGLQALIHSYCYAWC